ncbi:solute carrier family 3 member 2a [Epinephelus lanceolatus]|uniref:4F2 cell-surface antigen heavy chain-like n=1 Tax=Epinephelus lanceolatus TaxID=310571 RepID=UPI0014454544|nr:4F2 cell-surface antigen heavy chain-like [Epinephelus lanceolatus]XP_033465629.1 4F2 cell-surface antigen heavy chain-like [Epinephelus lanceolatus]XP_033466199.1 4F2 cell-surface antigen heavy chain-like [Epinephelus lanceolatus]XP_033466200.1 4F2 cell-surface antigen heavy chain-like [Epinephelus lanceolatus]
MNKDTEIDMKEVELNELDPEKQPMTGDGQAAGGEKNGSVKLKVPEDEVTFTGLSKEELMKVAGTPGWVRTRWVLLVLFWLGWVGMLAGAIVIIVRAPRCKPIPTMNWWNDGPLYQISDLEAFSEGLKGVEAKLDEINKLKVKGLVLGPLHTVQEDQPNTLNLQQIDPTQGNQDALVAVLEKAHKKGISVVLDLTPNYRGASPWFTPGDVGDVMDKVKAAAEHWLDLGVDGIKVSDLTVATNSLDWSKLREAVQGNRTDNTKSRALMGVVEGVSPAEVSQLINTTGVDLVLSDLLSSKKEGKGRIMAMDTLHSQQRSLGWGLGAAQQDQLSKQAATPALIRLYQLLLFTMPGTPVFTYGDEIGLQAVGAESPKMVWDIEEKPAEGEAVNETAEAQREERVAVRTWFKSLSDLRGKERSLLHGDYYPLSSSTSSLSFLRVWDQSERFITAVNWGATAETLQFKLALTGSTEGLELPERAKVKLSTDKDQEVDSMVDLDKITLAPGQAVLLQFPYAG